MQWGSPDPGYRFRLIQILEGGLRGGAFPLKDGDNLLGREIGDITFPTDGFVSGRHALLTVRQDRLVMRGRRLVERHLRAAERAVRSSSSGDQFLIGRPLVRVDVG